MISTPWAETVKSVEKVKTEMSTAGSDKILHLWRSGRKGFTLLELIVVMIIMTIILGVAGPRFVGVTGGSGLSHFSKGVASYLKNARELSVAMNASVKVGIDVEEGWIACVNDERDFVSLPPIEIPESIQVALEIDRGQRENVIVFYPLGNSTECRIVLESENGETKTIEIEGITGEIYID